MFLSFSPPIRFIEKPIHVHLHHGLAHKGVRGPFLATKKRHRRSAARAARVFTVLESLISFGFQMFPASHDGVEP